MNLEHPPHPPTPHRGFYTSYPLDQSSTAMTRHSTAMLMTHRYTSGLDSHSLQYFLHVHHTVKLSEGDEGIGEPQLPTTKQLTKSRRLVPHISFYLHPSLLLVSATLWSNLGNLAKLLPSLSLGEAAKLFHAFVSSRIDYSKNILPLRHIQNSAVRILDECAPPAPTLKPLHWLPVKHRIIFNLSLSPTAACTEMPQSTSKNYLGTRPPPATIWSNTANLLKVPLNCPV